MVTPGATRTRRQKRSRHAISPTVCASPSAVTTAPRPCADRHSTPGRIGHHFEVAEGSVSRTPEEAHLAEQERLLAELTEQLATKEAEYATVGVEFARFRAAYLARFAPLYAELDQVEAEIARLLADRPHATSSKRRAARSRAAAAEARARESAEAAEEAAGAAEEPSTEVREPDPALRSLYREAAKRLHPDLAEDDEERARRTRLMAAVNQAYAEGDAAAIQRILEGEAARPEDVAGDGLPARLARVMLKIARVRARFTELVELHSALESDPMWELFATVRDAAARGEDPLAPVERDLRLRMQAARDRLADLRAGTAA